MLFFAQNFCLCYFMRFFQLWFQSWRPVESRPITFVLYDLYILHFLSTNSWTWKGKRFWKRVRYLRFEEERNMDVWMLSCCEWRILVLISASKKEEGFFLLENFWSRRPRACLHQVASFLDVLERVHDCSHWRVETIQKVTSTKITCYYETLSLSYTLTSPSSSESFSTLVWLCSLLFEFFILLNRFENSLL